MDAPVSGGPVSSFVPKLATGVDLVDRAWGGFYRGGTYLVYGRAASGRDLFALRFLQTGAEAGETCLFLSPARPKDLLIQAASIGFDLRQSHAAGRVRLLRVPPSLSEGGEEDEGIARALRDLVALVRQHRPARLILGDFTPFVLFRSFDRFRAALVEMLEQTDVLDTTTLLVMGEPANAQSRRVLDFLTAQTTGTLHVAMPDDENAPTRRVTLIPNIGHVRRRLVETWDLDDLLDERPAPAPGARRRLAAAFGDPLGGEPAPPSSAPPRPRFDDAFEAPGAPAAPAPTAYTPIHLGGSAATRPPAAAPVWADDALGTDGSGDGPPAFVADVAVPASRPLGPAGAGPAPSEPPAPTGWVDGPSGGRSGGPFGHGLGPARPSVAAEPVAEEPGRFGSPRFPLEPAPPLRARPIPLGAAAAGPSLGAPSGKGPAAPPPAEETAAAPVPPHTDRAGFARVLARHFGRRHADGTPFVVVAIRLEAGSTAGPLRFEFLTDLVVEALGPTDQVLVAARRERLVVLLAGSTDEAAAAFFARLKQRLRDEAPYQSEGLLHAISAILVPNGEPFLSAEDLLAYALDGGG